MVKCAVISSNVHAMSVRSVRNFAYTLRTQCLSFSVRILKRVLHGASICIYKCTHTHFFIVLQAFSLLLRSECEQEEGEDCESRHTCLSIVSRMHVKCTQSRTHARVITCIR